MKHVAIRGEQYKAATARLGRGSSGDGPRLSLTCSVRGLRPRVPLGGVDSLPSLPAFHTCRAFLVTHTPMTVSDLQVVLVPRLLKPAGHFVVTRGFCCCDSVVM